VSAFVLQEQSVKTDANKKTKEKHVEVSREGADDEVNNKNDLGEANGCGSSKPCSELCGELSSAQEVPTTRKTPQRKTPSQLAMEALEAMAAEEEACWVMRRKKAEEVEKEGREAATSREEGEAALSRQAAKKKREEEATTVKTAKSSIRRKKEAREATTTTKEETTKMEEEVAHTKAMKKVLKEKATKAMKAATKVAKRQEREIFRWAKRMFGPK